MRTENRHAKKYIKLLPADLALKLFDNYQIPSPHKEILISVCVVRKSGYAGVEYISKTYQLNLGYWTFCDKLQEGLQMFHKAHHYYGRDYNSFIEPNNLPKT